MDKFDESVKRAKQVYEPNSNFVEVTMKQIINRQPRKRWSVKLWLPALAGAVAVIVIIFVASPVASHNNPLKTTNTVNPSAAQTKQQSGASSPTAPSVAAGTDNASLASDLNSINSSQSQEDSDQGGANSALNDSSQQITVPTD